jgi:cation-transporting P-type ATPase I
MQERVRQAVGLSLISRSAGLAGPFGRALRGQHAHRVEWSGDSRVHIAVRGITGDRGASLARAVEAGLERHAGVRWAAVNAPLGVVVVDCCGEVSVAELIGIVEQTEQDHRAVPEPAADRPGAVDRVPGAVAALAASVAGLSFAGAGRVLRAVRLPAELGSLVYFVDTQPRLRAAVERAAGPDRADLLLAGASALGQSAAQGVSALVLDVALRAGQLAEAVMQRGAWARSEPQLCGVARSAAAKPVTPERPRQLPWGPVEQYSERIGLGAAGAFGGVLAASRDPRRAAGVAMAGLPKAALLGREGFAVALGCVLAGRGAVVMDHRVLRRLDRIDTIVVDADVLTTGAMVVGDVVPVGGADAAVVTGIVQALFAADHLGATRSDGTFTLGPLDALGLPGGTGARTAGRLTARGASRVLGLAQGRRLRAVVGVVQEQAAGAGMVLAAARRADAVFMLAGPSSSAGPAHGAARALSDGRRLVASVRELQAKGAGVLLVSRQRRALAAADCGVGVVLPDGRPPWGAHIMIGDDLAVAALVIDAVSVAHEASRRGVALSQAGSALGGVLAFSGQASAAARRSLEAVNGAAAIALAGGAWSAAELARRPAAPPVPRLPWHAMPARAVLDRLGSRPAGLSSGDARARWHPDEQQAPRQSLPRAFLAELSSPLTPILAGGAALSASIGAVTDAVIIAGVGAVSALMGGAQRVYTDRSMARLLEASAVSARVLRDGRERTVPAAGLVVGDIVLLGGGDVVPADCRLQEARALQIDESSLTGESFPVDKATAPVTAEAIAGRSSMLYEGSTVAAGRATAVVVETGSTTETGRALAALFGAAPVTGVEARLAQITRTTLPIALGSAGAVVAAGLLRGRPARDSIGAAVGLAVASVPEGLPFLVTAAQLAAARRLAARGALVRNPRTIEALGRVNVLCFDKTGTLTQGRMAVAALSDGAASRRPGMLRNSHRDVLAAALRATPAAPDGRKAEHMTDEAVISGAAAEQVIRSDGHPSWHLVDALPFEPSRSYHASLGSTANGMLLSVKGAPEVILPRCARWRGRSLVPRLRQQLTAQLGQLTKDGYRVLAVAENPVEAGYQLSGDNGELSFTGFVAFGDPVRVTAGASVRELRDAGVHVVMITGDHPATAEAIATELDVLNGGTIVTGAELDRLDDKALAVALANASVIARCTPAHKVRVVQAFQATGRIVAMTGDGANDAAAIRLADVGIALGRRGTPAASAAADVVVSDDRLETILSAVVEGRAMWRSVRQAIGILVGGNIGEIGFTLFGALLTGTSPLSARQLLLVNLLTDLAPAVAIALRAPPPEAKGHLLAEGPDASLGSALTEEVAVRAVATGAAASSAWLAARATGRPARARTVGLAAVVGAELGQTLLVGGRSPAVAAACLASTGVLIAVVQTPGVSQFFDCTPLGPVGWGIAVGSSITATAGSLLLPRFGRSLAPTLQSLAGSPEAAQMGSLVADLRARVSGIVAADTGQRRESGSPGDESDILAL